jgi:hypothetical protein
MRFSRFTTYREFSRVLILFHIVYLLYLLVIKYFNSLYI